jgi:hypothetical protein
MGEEKRYASSIMIVAPNLHSSSTCGIVRGLPVGLFGDAKNIITLLGAQSSFLRVEAMAPKSSSVGIKNQIRGGNVRGKIGHESVIKVESPKFIPIN